MVKIINLKSSEGLGNATSNDVKEGVTFTSENGIRQVGTAQGSDAIVAVDTVFNDDDSITETYENGKVVTTTFTGDNEITETIVNGGVTSTRVTTLSEDEECNIIETIVEGDKTTVKKTVFNSDGSIDEQII